MKPKLILGLALLLGGMALCVSGLWLLLSPPQYAATVRIKTEQMDVVPSGFSYDPYFTQADFEIMQSTLVLSNVVAGLNLNEVWGKKLYNRMPLKYAECYAIIKNHMRLAPVPPALKTSPRLIDVTYYSSDPKEAADMANAIAEGYQKCCVQLRKDLTAGGLPIWQQHFQDEEKQILVLQTSTNRPFGAALLALGLFPLLGGILLLKSKP